jgi:hypothetical protein
VSVWKLNGFCIFFNDFNMLILIYINYFNIFLNKKYF